MLNVSILCPTLFRHILGQQTGKFVDRHGAEVIAVAGPDRHLAVLDFAVTYDQQERYFLQRMLADLEADFLVPEIRFHPITF
jgi:hypothetical protein